ncbi:metal-dependent hydrolase family protein [Bombilactobacillus bombi]|uniref:metal-dependent hydrolase family protein n=1 Tax=Bombilactobacillus bombi TaxID=1303590 RepID=UPI0015E605C4|nr:amidohydrolase family protein [Bombilactobacillus bombi]MBA1434386.1 amidohydrolase family protein [Bombilactobacillus bombi]
MTKTLFFNFSLFTGNKEELQPQAWMLVDNQTGKITDSSTSNPPAADQKVDLANKYVMPGLINCHTHITMDPATGDGGTSANVIASTVRAVMNLHTLLKSGVTYIRECGSTYDIDITLSQLIAEGLIEKAPEILPSGRPYSMTGGHGDFPNFGHLVDSPDEMRKAVRQGQKIGAKAIKVMATGGVMTKNDFMDDPQLSIAEIQAAVDEAHHKDNIVAAHAEGNPGILNAIKAGVDSIEHGFYVNDEEIDLMLQQKTYLTPTIVADWAIPEYGHGILPDWEIKKAADALDDLCKNIAHAHERGVAITLGTDAGTPFNDFSMTPVELELMVEHGFSNYEALLTSCRNSSKLMKIDSEYGTLEPNKYADFLVLDNNPLEDIKALQQADKAVYKKGQRVY